MIKTPGTPHPQSVSTQGQATGPLPPPYAVPLRADRHAQRVITLDILEWELEGAGFARRQRRSQS